MGEAGFSSTHVKTKVEQALICHSKESTYKPQVHDGNNVSSSRSFDQLGGSIDHAINEQVHYFSQKGIRKTIESGSITLPCGESAPLKDAIVIFSSEKTSAYAENITKDCVDKLEEKTSCLSLDLNIAIKIDSQNVHLTGDFGILELNDKQNNFKTQEL